MPAVLRPATPTDIPSVLAVINSVCSEGRWMRTSHYMPTPEWEHAFANTACPRHLLAVAEVGGIVAGWVRMFPLAGHKCEAKLGIGLLAPYRDQGLGTAMVVAALYWAADAGYRWATLTTHQDNLRAIHTFTKCGFIANGWDDDDLFMTLRIGWPDAARCCFLFR